MYALGQQTAGCRGFPPARDLCLRPPSDAGVIGNAPLRHSHGICCPCGRDQGEQKTKSEAKHRN